MSFGWLRPYPQSRRDSTAPAASGAAPQRIAGRYEVGEELGRGGMARVLRVKDATSGRDLALKQLLAQNDEARTREAATLFEREFHTLAQLSHPRVIEVYDYGVDEAGPYYTMELLDGGDLRERSPLPWREACELLYDVCSSLALLHSRRLVHRDVSPRNVRCTHAGHAKLIDFGAMVPMASGAPLVGTPPFVAPEVVHGSMLDARTDLFSLGATLYFALTGRLAYPARDFTQLVECWANKPPLPSQIVPDIPAALDQLVSSMIGLEPALRPRSAFEVMQRLAALANIERAEPLGVSSGYLATPVLVGREAALVEFRGHAQRALRGRSQQGLMISAEAGLGRSRMLDAGVLEAKLLGANVLRAAATKGATVDLAVARTLAEQLLVVLPVAAPQLAHGCGTFATLFESEAPANTQAAAPAAVSRLKPFPEASGERMTLQRALADWFLYVSDHHPLLIAVDDAQGIDEASIGFLAVLAERGGRHRLLVVVSVEQNSLGKDQAAIEVLASKCRSLGLHALELTQTEQLLSSVFGDVPNLALLCTRLHAIAHGNPRECMALAQHLVDRGLIRYDGGHWTLPEQLAAHDLPASSEDAFRARVSALQPNSRRLIEAQALAVDDAFSRDDYALLEPAADSRSLDAAITELVTHQIVIGDGHNYLLAQRKGVVCDQLDPAARKLHYRALAEMQTRSGRPILGTVRYLLLSDQPEAALARVSEALPKLRDRTELVAASRMDAATIADTLKLALHEARRLDRPARDIHELLRWIALLSVASDDALYWHAAPSWLEQLKLDSGLSDWYELKDVADPSQRLLQALQRAGERFANLPDAQRVYPVQQALRMLVHYVVISIAIGARTLDARLLLSLPELLEPFTPLSPMLHAIWQNALATRESSCYRQTEKACARWVEVYARLADIRKDDPELVDSIRNAVAFGVGLGEASMGLESAMRWAEILDRDPLQQVNAMSLRKVVRLQRGDLEGAEHFRKQAELLAVQASMRQMFSNMLTLEIGVHAAAWDLTGVRQIAARIAPFAERHRGWAPFRHLAAGHFQRLRGDIETACREFELCLALCAPDPQDPGRSIVAWPPATAAYAETLVALGRAEEARRYASEALASCAQRGIVAGAHEIGRALALAEAKLGEHEAAAARLDALIKQQLSLGVAGLNLGASYEARARIAIWAGDQAKVEHFAALAAKQYRHGHGSPLGARYERLMEEARGAGIAMLPQLSAYESTVFGNTDFGTRISTVATIASVMKGASDRPGRARVALQLLCEARGAGSGHLYLNTGNELVLAASTADLRPDIAMDEFVTRFWTEQITNDDPDTEIPLQGDADNSFGTVVWTDLTGAVHQPLLLSCVRDGTMMFAGVALLIPRQQGPRPVASMQVVAELGAYLLRVGDTTGVPVSS
jgi:hypothetical protein